MNISGGQTVSPYGLESKLLLTPTHGDLRQAILQRMFELPVTTTKKPPHPGLDVGVDAYFDDCYEEQCEIAGSHASAATHIEILDIIVHLRSVNLTRSEIIHILEGINSLADSGRLMVLIDLAARLWLMVSIGSIHRSIVPSRTVSWQEGKLKNALQGIFSPKSTLSERVKLPKNFTAANLERIAGLKVMWVSNLSDHLMLRDDDTKVMVFHHASFLELHKGAKSSIFPEGLLEETTQTLGLLIPFSDKQSQAWFRQKQRTLQLDAKAGTYGPLNTSARQIEQFNYWQDRLIILKQTFDEAEPGTLRLWWYDDRKKVQWYTFWVAICILLLTVVFGIIQSISGVVQAWAAVKSLSG